MTRPRAVRSAARVRSRSGSVPQHAALQRRQAVDGPLGGILAGARDHLRVDLPFAAQEAQHRVQRRQPDRALAQSGDAQPVLVELEPIGQQLGDRLMQAGDEKSSDPRLTHDPASLRSPAPGAIAVPSASSGIVLRHARCAVLRSRRPFSPAAWRAAWTARTRPSCASAAERIVERQLRLLREVADPVFIVVEPAAKTSRDLGVEVVPDVIARRRAARRHLHGAAGIAARAHAGRRLRSAVPHAAAARATRPRRRPPSW